MKHERFIVRAYRALMRLYPRQFRNEYGADMAQLFCDQCNDDPTWRVCVRSALDLAITIPHQHLEKRMRRIPSPLVPLLYLALATAGLLLVIIGGTNNATLFVGLGIAVAAGTIGILAWRRTAPIHTSNVTAGWWKFLVAGPCLIALVIVAAGSGVEAWFLGMVTVLAAFVLIATGLVSAPCTCSIDARSRCRIRVPPDRDARCATAT